MTFRLRPLTTKALCYALAATVMVGARPSSAQGSTDPAAIQLKSKGDSAIEAGDFEQALTAYSKALAIEPSPALHYNRGRALQALGRNAEALDEFEQFQSTATVELKAAVPKLDEMVASVRQQVSELTIKCAVAGANLHVGGKALALPLSRPLRFDPGNIDVEVVATDYETWRTRVTFSGGEKRQISVQLRPQERRGSLTVTSPILGALVSVDGKASGTVPLEIRLDSGEHTVTLSRPDYKTTNTHFVLQPNERRSLSLTLEQLPHFYERWWFWTGVGAVVTTGVVVGIALSTERAASRGDIAPGQITSPLLTY